MKRRAKVLAVIAAVLWVSAGCSQTVDEPCAWCGNSPSVEYESSSGEKVYVCEECSSTCMFCGDPATRHYSAVLGEMFVCDDCYDSVTQE